MVLQLEYVQVVHRHGERTPLLFGPHDKTNWNLCHRASKIAYTIPHNTVGVMDKLKGMLRYIKTGNAQPMTFNITLNSGVEFNCAPGQLTDTGRRTLFNFGTWLREKYVNKERLLSEEFKKEEFHLRSTNFQRTLESLQSLLQGMFRKHHGVIDVQVNDLMQDTLGCSRYCPKLKSLKNQSHEEIKKKFDSKTKLIQRYFSDNFSKHFATLSPYAIYDLVASSKAHGFKKFTKVPSYIMNDLEKYSLELWFNHLNTKEGLALNTGCIMKEISDLFLKKATDIHNPVKMSIFSAHDVTVYPMLMAVGINSPTWPKFGANLIFELLKESTTQERYVQMRYNGKVLPMPKCKEAASNPNHCPIDEFVKICNDTYMNNFTQACMKE
ncbi:lysophosphatidic acid phosphatase type 6 [Nematocida sp. AWRm80]|nr:lysophosphatidic acid phosphatase type 6 [Nematocida sp. AWRm80]